MGARRFVSLVVVPLCVLAGVLVGDVGSAGALVSQFGSSGEGAGQFENVLGVAVDQASGDVYLMDMENRRVDEFTGEGVFVMAWGWGVADGVTQAFQTCTTTCFKGIPGSGAGQLANESRGLAVDNDPLSASYQDVYVSEQTNKRVEKFSPSGSFISMFGKKVNENGGNICLAGEKCRAGEEGAGDGEFNYMGGAIAVGPTGDVFVGDHERVQEFSPEGVFVKSFAVSPEYPNSLAIDDAGDMYVLATTLAEYDSSGTLVRTLDSGGNPAAVTVDPSGNVFVGNVGNILEYGAGGEQLASFDGQEGHGTDGGHGIAFGEMIDRIYLPEGETGRETVRLLARPVPGPELVGEGSASAIEPNSVTLSATVNPEGNATTYRFEYGTTSVYGASVPIPEGSLTASFEDESAIATVTKLVAGATYHYRIVASDSKGRVATGQDQTFTTRPAVLIDSLSTTNVAATSATFEALLNPLGADATYRIEYDTSGYAPGGSPHGIGAAEGSLGAGSDDVPVSAHVDGLQVGTVYHYRVVAHDIREGIAYTVEGPDQTFTTHGMNSGQVLPDGRQWEMVSPANKLGTQILAIDQYSGEGAVIQAAAGGDAFTYVTSSPTEAEPQGYTNYLQVLATRGSSGWNSRDIATPHDSATGISVGNGEEYRFFSEDLSLGALQPFGAFVPSLSDEASEQTAYVRTDFLNGDTATPCLSACYRPMVTGAPGHANVPEGAAFGEEGLCSGNGRAVYCGPAFLGATPDMRHVVISSLASLTSISTKGTENLYEWSDGKLALVSALPDQVPTNGSPKLGSTLGHNARRAISDNGSRIVWSEFEGQDHLYMRDMGTDETVQLDAVQGGSGEGAIQPQFEIASTTGSRVFFSDGQKLTKGSAALPGEPDLYECEIVEEAGKLRCRLSDLTPAISGKPANVRGVIGASNDGTWVYYVAGTTLYVNHGGTTKPVAVLSSADAPDWKVEALDGLTATVSSNGRWLAFMSQRELTGYDTHDAVSGEPDEEVYLYDAEAGSGAGHIACASCNPTGARPVGVTDPGDGLTLGDRIWQDTPVAANIPGWTPYRLENALYRSRYLSDSGRLLFNSNDGLVAGDVNGTEDVYEYEPQGVGDCSSSSSRLSPSSDGCVGLISSGSSAEESGFLDASATGGDVFFLTGAKLSGEDRDTALDVYDAHECAPASPCFVTPPALSPTCDTGDSCKAAPSPQPAIFGAPSSATFSGAGNVGSRAVQPSVGQRGLTRAQKLARALKACHKKSDRRRSACIRKARARYAAKKTGVKASKRGRG